MIQESISKSQQFYNKLRPNSQTVFVKKERQQQYDQNITSEWKEARIRFFTYQIEEQLNDTKIQERQKIFIINLFISQKNIDLNNLGSLTKHRQKIQFLKQSFQQINKQYLKKQRKCIELQRILQNKQKRLKVIHIQYQKGTHNYCRYSISAFHFFKVVHDNKLLSQVTLKGVKVEQFLKFINLLNNINHNESIEYKQSNDINWMRVFNPSKYLKLSVDAQIKFDVSNKKLTSFKMNDLVFFISLFYWLSDITVYLKLEKWSSIILQPNTLQRLLVCLRKIKKIKLAILGTKEVNTASIRSILFGELASFTEIAHLSLHSFIFNLAFKINDYLAIEQNLKILFKNNPITHLKLYSCHNFPIFPQITTLQSINLQGVTFRKQCNFMGKILQSNSLLHFIKNSQIKQKWRIDEQLFKQVNCLIIEQFTGIYFGGILQKLPSKIKCLKIKNSKIWDVSYLSVIFPKLANLTELILSDISFGHQLLCTIPSPSLEKLHLSNNRTITGKDIEAIDSRWPYLRDIKLQQCLNISDYIWSICEFKGLTELSVDSKILGFDNYALPYLKCRGIIVNQCQLVVDYN